MGVLWAQAASNVESLISSLGFPIFVAVASAWAFLTGKIHSSSDMEERSRSIARLESQVDAYAAQYETKVLPIMNEAVISIRQMATVIEMSTNASTETSHALATISQTLARLEESMRLLHGSRRADRE